MFRFENWVDYDESKESPRRCNKQGSVFQGLTHKAKEFVPLVQYACCKCAGTAFGEGALTWALGSLFQAAIAVAEQDSKIGEDQQLVLDGQRFVNGYKKKPALTKKEQQSYREASRHTGTQGVSEDAHLHPKPDGEIGLMTNSRSPYVGYHTMPRPAIFIEMKGSNEEKHTAQNQNRSASAHRMLDDLLLCGEPKPVYHMVVYPNGGETLVEIYFVTPTTVPDDKRPDSKMCQIDMNLLETLPLKKNMEKEEVTSHIATIAFYIVEGLKTVSDQPDMNGVRKVWRSWTLLAKDAKKSKR